MIEIETLLGWIVNLALLTFLVIFIKVITPSLPRQNRKSTPAFPLHLTPLLGRGREIDQLKRLILTGQSGAIVGVFEQERTAILGYLTDPGHHQALYEEYADKLAFSLVDISMLPKDCQPSQFWQRALKPVEDKFNQSQTILTIYQTCQQDQFDEYCLDKLMVQVKQEGWRLVLMLHRFDELLDNSNLSNFLKQSEFFALLRRLASSRTPSPLSLIISGNLSLKQFHDQTKDLNPKGSPYFNFMESYEIVLGLLSDAKIDELLQKNGFSQVECQSIRGVAGQHPHFIRLVAEALQNAKEHQEVQPWEVVKQELPAIVANTLVNLNTEVCQTLVALVKGKQPATPTWIELLEKQGLLKKDQDQGLLKKDQDTVNNWQVSPPMLVTFINSKTEQELCNH